MTLHRKDEKAELAGSSIAIELDSSDVTAGEMLKGRVQLEVGEDIPARGVRLLVQGYETSIRHSGMGRSMKKERETAVWFDDELTLAGSPKTEVGSVLSEAVKGIFSRDCYPVINKGKYTYDFEYQLPDMLPGDYESVHGDVAIRYELRAYVDIPLRVDIEATRKLTVYEIVQHSDDALSAEVTLDKQCLVPKGGDVLLDVTIPRHAYKLGEQIALSLDIDNRCSQLVDSVIVSLKQIESVQQHGVAETESATLAAQTFDSAKAGPGEKQHHDLVYQIPKDLYPSVERGRLINVTYCLSVEVVIDVAVNAIIEIPIRLYEEPGQPGGQA